MRLHAWIACSVLTALAVSEADAQRLTRLTFTARDENWTSWALDTDGAERVALFSSGETVCSNGEWFCGPQNIWRMRFENGQALSMDMVLRGAYHPRVSPDGLWVAYMKHNGTDYDIWVAPNGRFSESQLFQSIPGYQERFPNWSNDSQWIAFDSDRPSELGTEGFQVFVARIADREDPDAARQITTVGQNNKHPTWNADGTEIAYVGDAQNRRALSAVRLDTGAYRLITPEAGQNRHPDWSPDGRWIAFVSDRWDGIGDIALIDARGGGPVVRVSVGMDGHDDFPEFSRDSQRILFTGTHREAPYAPNKELYVAEDLPFTDAAVPVQSSSFGGLKGRYTP